MLVRPLVVSASRNTNSPTRISNRIALLDKTREDFDSDSLERKQYVLKALGAELKLLGRTLTFIPVKYLIPIEKAISKISSESESARTWHQQMKKRLK